MKRSQDSGSKQAYLNFESKFQIFFFFFFLVANKKHLPEMPCNIFRSDFMFLPQCM